MRQINAAGLALIKEFEGCKLEAYQDQGGVWTIGYGHTGPEVVEGMWYTPAQAEGQLLNDLKEKAYPIDNWLSENVNDNQYAAICSLCFNVGITRVRKSKTLQLINEGKDPSAEWMGFDTINGIPSNGLARRREDELKLYHTLS